MNIQFIDKEIINPALGHNIEYIEVPNDVELISLLVYNSSGSTLTGNVSLISMIRSNGGSLTIKQIALSIPAGGSSNISLQNDMRACHNGLLKLDVNITAINGTLSIKGFYNIPSTRIL